MLFKLNINLKDNDYLDYNVFWMFRSPYGKKQQIQLRILLTLPFVLACFISLIREDCPPLVIIVPLIVMLVLLQVLFKPINIWLLKKTSELFEKKGENGVFACR